eukprot:scaffold42096_cov150-Skeletonema_dohrnii-CCMP3373.AAC.2
MDAQTQIEPSKQEGVCIRHGHPNACQRQTQKVRSCEVKLSKSKEEYARGMGQRGNGSSEGFTYTNQACVVGGVRRRQAWNKGKGGYTGSATQDFVQDKDYPHHICCFESLGTYATMLSQTTTSILAIAPLKISFKHLLSNTHEHCQFVSAWLAGSFCFFCFPFKFSKDLISRAILLVSTLLQPRDFICRWHVAVDLTTKLPV